MARRVVITGLGVVTTLGTEIPEFWDNVCAGKSGIAPVRRFDCSQWKVNFGGELTTFNAVEHLKHLEKDLKRMDRFVQFAVVAADKAIRHSGFDFSTGDPYRHGVLVGSGIGGLNEIETQHQALYEKGPARVSPFMIPKLLVNAGSGNISVLWGLRGPNSAVCTACASATNAIGDAFKLIQGDMADIMVTGGSEAALTPMGLSGFSRMQALSTRSENCQTASRPFDRDRDGFVMAEGAGIIVIEEYEHAKARGANILAEILGYGMSADGTHMTAPCADGSGARYAMQQALRDAKIDRSTIDYVNAHGTSTPLGDKAETLAIKAVFGEYAKSLAISSAKSQVGHLLGASGGVEVALCVQSLLHQVATPTSNLENPDPDCDLDYVPNQARDMKIRRILKNSFGFGGHNACLVLGSV